jgi:WD40 repeat protein
MVRFLILTGGLLTALCFHASAADNAKPAVEKKAQLDRHGDPLPAGAVARLGTVRFRHNATSVAFSPDGRILASGGSDNQIRLFERTTGKVLRTLAGHQPRTYHAPKDPKSPLEVLVSTTGPGSVTCLTFAPDGKTLASGGWDDMVRIWDVPTGQEVRKIVAHQAMVAALVYSPDGKVLASRGGLDGIVRLWDPQTGFQVRQLTGFPKVNPWRFNREAAVAISPDGQTLAVGDAQAVQLYDLASGKEKTRLQGQRSVLSVAFSADGKLLASGGVDPGKDQNSLRLWDLAMGQELRRCQLPKNEPPIHVAFAPDGRRLAAAVEEDDVHLFDVTTGQPVHRLKHYWASRIAFAPDGKTLVTARGPVLRVWDPATGQELFQDFDGHHAGVAAVAVSPDGKLVATGGDDLRIWDAATSKSLRRISIKGGINALAFSPDGKLLASAGKDRIVHLWEVATGKVAGELKGHKLMLCGLAFSRDGTRLASGDVQSTIRIWDVAGGKELHRIDNYSGTEYLSLAFSPDGRRLACAGAWNDSSFLPAKGAAFTINGKEVKSDGRFSIQGVEMERKDGYYVLQWDTATGKPTHKFGGLSDKVRSVAYSPDGRTLAAASRDGRIVLWDVQTGKDRLHILAHPGHTDTPFSLAPGLAFTPDGQTLISAGSDKTIRLWDPVTARERGRFQAPDGLTGIAVTPDGKTLVSGSSDTTALFWDLGAVPAGPEKEKEHLIIYD